MMRFLLDTCVLSDTIGKQPNEGLRQWLLQADPATTFLSVVSLGEIQRGIERKPASKRRTELERWFSQQILPQSVGRIFSIDLDTMQTWSHMMANLERKGRPMPLMDSLIAATALTHDLMIVTRNVGDFEPTGVRVLNPWT